MTRPDVSDSGRHIQGRALRERADNSHGQVYGRDSLGPRKHVGELLGIMRNTPNSAGK